MHQKLSSVDIVVAQAQSRDIGLHAVVATDIDGMIVYWNEHACTLYGWPEHEAIGRNILDVTPTYSSADEAAEIMELLRQGKSWSGSFLVQRRDGQRLLTHVSDVPVLVNGAVAGIIGISNLRG